LGRRDEIGVVVDDDPLWSTLLKPSGLHVLEHPSALWATLPACGIANRYRLTAHADKAASFTSRVFALTIVSRLWNRSLRGGSDPASTGLTMTPCFMRKQ
jgi:hypothetical protein